MIKKKLNLSRVVEVVVIVLIALLALFIAAKDIREANAETLTPADQHISVTLPSFVTLGQPFLMTFRSDIGNLTLVAPPFEGTVSPVSVNDSNVKCTDMLANFQVWGCASNVEFRWIITPTELGTHVFVFESYGGLQERLAYATATTTVIAPPIITATVPAFVTFGQPFTVTFNSSGGSALVVTSPFSETSSPYATDGSGQRCLHISINPDRYSCPVDMEMTWVMVPRILGRQDLKFEILDDSHEIVTTATFTTIVLRLEDKLYTQWLPLISTR